MASGTITMDGSGVMGGRVTWSSTYNTAKNRSTITATLQIKLSGVREGEKYTITYVLGVYDRNKDELEHIWTSKVITIPANTSSWITLYTAKVNTTHKADGSNYAYIDASATMKSGAGSVTMDDKKITLDKIYRGATISAAPNFTDADDDNPTITYSNKSGSSTTSLKGIISLDGTNEDIVRDDLALDGTSYTFELTDAERDILRNATLNGSASRSVRFYVKSTVAGYDYSKHLEKTFTVVNANPELSFFFLDTNATTSALTGDSLTTVIKGYSNLAYEMSAAGVKGASITKYSAVNGTNTLTTASGVFNKVESGDLALSATDNRGLTTTQSFNLNLIDYFKPTCSQEVSIEMTGETTATATIVVKGEWSSRHFGAVHNSLTIGYRYKADSGEWSDWTESDYITDNNSYSITFTRGELDYAKSYTFQSRAVDSLDSAITAEYPITLIPVFEWSKTDFQFNVPVAIKGDLTVEGNLIMNGEEGGGAADYIIETGTEAMGTNGTWYWEKWKSGKAMCYGVRNYGNMGVSTSWGNLYRSSIFTQTLPTGLFKSAPEVINIDFSHGGMSAWVVKHEQTAPGADTTGAFMVVRAASATLSQVYLDFNLIGRWK